MASRLLAEAHSFLRSVAVQTRPLLHQQQQQQLGLRLHVANAVSSVFFFREFLVSFEVPKRLRFRDVLCLASYESAIEW